jgi:hypothetical protein
MSSFLKSLDDEAAYLEAGLERTRAELERNQAELERIQERLAANREERRRVATQSQSSRDGTIMPGDLPHVAPSASTAASSAPTAVPSAPTTARPEKKRKANKVAPLPEYNFFLSVDGSLLDTEEIVSGGVTWTLKSRFEHEVDNRPEKYSDALSNRGKYNYSRTRRCLNNESPIQDPDVACCYCTEHKMPCMRLAWDEYSGLAMVAAPLAPSLRKGREWDEVQYWMLP